MDKDRLDGIIERDRRALSSDTSRRVPSLDETRRLARHVREPRRRLRWLVPAAAALVVLFVVPTSYPVARGSIVRLDVAGEVSPAARAEIARGLRAGTEGLEVEATPDGDGIQLETRVDGAGTRETHRAAEAFVRRLRDAGIAADASVDPWTETVSGRGLGLAVERVRRWWIDVNARSTEEIEADVRARLAAIGFEDATVRVTRDGPNIGIDVQARDARGRMLETEMRHTGDSTAADRLPMELELPDLSDLDHLPVAQRRDAVARRLREAGIDARVTIKDGRIIIEREETETR
jgi:hypothetical protein